MTRDMKISHSIRIKITKQQKIKPSQIEGLN